MINFLKHCIAILLYIVFVIPTMVQALVYVLLFLFSGKNYFGEINPVSYTIYNKIINL